MFICYMAWLYVCLDCLDHRTKNELILFRKGYIIIFKLISQNNGNVVTEN